MKKSLSDLQDYQEKTIAGRVYVLGEATSGKTTFINLAKENWLKINTDENAQKLFPEFIEENGWRTNIAESDLENVNLICVCHDIAKPFPKELQKAIKKLKKQNLFLVLTKSDLAENSESIRKEIQEKFSANTFSISKDKIEKESGFYMLVSELYIKLSFANMKLWTEDFGNHIQETFSTLKESVSHIRKMNNKFKITKVEFVSNP